MRSILVTRLDGLGDIALGSGLIAGLHQRWPTAQITLLVRPQHAGVGTIFPEWLRVWSLGFDPRESVAGREAQIISLLRDTASACRADLAVAAEYNRVWAGEIVAMSCGAANVVSFDGPIGLNVHHRSILDALNLSSDFSGWRRVPADEHAREIDKYRTLARAVIGHDAPPPAIEIADSARERASQVWSDLRLDDGVVVFFPSSGSRLEKSLSASNWNQWLRRFCERTGRQCLLLGAAFDRAALEEIRQSPLLDAVRSFVVPDDDVGLLAALLDRSAAYVGADTGPMHLSAVLGKPTLGVFGGGHDAERFLPVGPRAWAVRMRLPCFGCGWQCPFDERLCIRRMPIDPLMRASLEMLDDPTPHDLFTPRIVELVADAELSRPATGAVARLHVAQLRLNHEVIEHHDHLARIDAQRRDALTRLESATRETAEAQNTLRLEMRQLHAGAQALLEQAHREKLALQEMTQRNELRDQAIRAATEEIERIRQSFARLSAVEGRQDETISRLLEQTHRVLQTLSEMTTQGRQRDVAISALNDQTHTHRMTIEQLAPRLAMVETEIEQLRAELADLRARGIRIPAAVARAGRRLLGRPENK